MGRSNAGISSVKVRLPTKKTSLRNPGGDRSSKRSIDPRAFQETSDVSRRKKVRFADPDNAGEQSFREDSPSLPAGPTRITNSDDPKTSEYKFYKKLLEEAGSSFHSSQLHKQDDHLKKFKTSSHVEEPINKSASKFVGNISLSPTSVAWKSPSSSTGSWRNSELNNRISCKYKMDRPPSPIENVTPLDEQLFLDGAQGNQEKEYKDGEIFLRKRQNILKVAAKSLSQVDEFTLKGPELIPVLLQRMGIGGKTSNHDELSKPGNKKLNIRSQFLASHHLDTDLEEPVHESLRSNPMLIRARQFRGKDLCESWFSEVDELVPSLHENVEDQLFPHRQSHRTSIQHNRRKVDWLLDFGQTKSASDIELFTESASTEYSCHTADTTVFKWDSLPHRIFSSQGQSTELPLVPYWNSSILEFNKPYNEEESFIPHRNSGFFELDILHSPDEPQQPEKEPFPFRFLDWDWSSMEKNKGRQSIVSSTAEDPDHLPLTLYRAPNYQGLKEECRSTDRYEGSNIISSQSSSSFNIHRDMVRPGFDAFLLSSILDFGQGWKSSTDSDIFGENIVERRLSCIYKGGECDENIDESGLMETNSQFIKDKCNSNIFSPVGSEIYVGSMPKVYPLLTDSWYASEG